MLVDRRSAGPRHDGARDDAAAALILLVDDNPTNLQVLYQTLDGHGYRLLAARSGKDALTIAERAMPDLILLDVMMPEMDGFETCARLRAGERTSASTIIFLSAVTDGREKVRGLELGAVDFVNKPFQAEEVLARVRTHLRLRDLERQLRRRNEELQHELTVAQELLREARTRVDGALLGDSESVRRLRREIAGAAAEEASALLIAGPTGSDHEAIARAVHHQSPRAARALIAVNCVALASAPTLLDQTGPGLDLPSKLVLAAQGTLYLEGIQHLSMQWQRELAAMIRGSLGSRESSMPRDVRVIAAVTGDLDQELAAARILPELHRAFGRTLDLPPLRSRADDLPTLARHFVRRQAERLGRPVPHIPDETLERLKRYRWPGNLGELRSVIERALAMTPSEVLEVSDHLLDDSVRIGSYQLVERLGAGGMGEVWLARHQLLARPAAVKVIRDAALGGDGEDRRVVRQRFEREAHATASLQSPHTVQLYDFGTTESGSFYYVMERLRGMDLQRLVERHGPMPASRVVFLLDQACRSLAEAHAQGLVHRDIKPANLFVCRLGTQFDFLKVLDFGVVSRRTRGAVQPVTTAGDVLGTPAFLAPELGTGDRVFDQRADIYALGCVAFWLLTGRLPFDGKDPLALLMHHAQTPPEAPSVFSEQPVPAALDEVVLACLSKEPRGRPRTADGLRERLLGIPLPAPWSERDARSWWELHEPDLGAAF